MHIILIILFMAFAFARTLKACQFFQQSGYSAQDFTKFIFKRAQFVDKRLSLAIFFYSILAAGFKNYYADTAAMGAMFLIAALRHKNPFRESRPKKQFALTPRARRIMAISLIAELYLAHALFTRLDWFSTINDYCMCRITGLLILLVQSPPFILMLADALLSPLEAILKRHYYAEAVRKMRSLDPTVIGITGSFGKTSTKNILCHILSQKASTLMTSRSINTLFGVVVAIRRELAPEHKYFIVEIGTSMPGRVAKICRLASPRHAILTAVGNMHYAYFKTAAAIAKEKFSIFKTVTEQGGIAVVNGLQVDDKFAREFLPGYGNAFFLSDKPGGKDTYEIENAKVTKKGVAFTLAYGGKKHDILAPIYGIHKANDIALSFIMAHRLGMKEDEIISAISTLPQIKNRQYVDVKNGVTYLRDAYNSNPDGFISALDTLDVLADGGRRILVTPGMLELGKLHGQCHKKVAEYALAKTDVAIAVLPERIRDFTETFRRGMKKGQQLVCARSFAESDEWMDKNLKKGDTVLIENDLADIYAEKIDI
ncbi:MAG: UDP-N-acetylmuramoyl-tripeptide--D-alanyl-D-alanine ligase [Rickettsiales bacterium]|jgi:UDP-N-acetylmuramoyl-tripeptide--D-alanyl-D-alanine ligase|nr:UDP-N-acetylmuramoyl-tripeptide--D-alanyl-D-alanine ligase [Rickettsiales bacterium]